MSGCEFQQQWKGQTRWRLPAHTSWKRTFYIPWNGIVDVRNSIVTRPMRIPRWKFSMCREFMLWYVCTQKNVNEDNDKLKFNSHVSHYTTTRLPENVECSTSSHACNNNSKQQSRSNETHLVLQNTSPATAGKFTCEVSADFPSFQTIHVSGDLEVVGKLT